MLIYFVVLKTCGLKAKMFIVALWVVQPLEGVLVAMEKEITRLPISGNCIGCDRIY